MHTAMTCCSYQKMIKIGAWPVPSCTMEEQLAREVAEYKGPQHEECIFNPLQDSFRKFCALMTDERKIEETILYLPKSIPPNSDFDPQERGLPSPYPDKFQLHQTIQGIRRKKGDSGCPKAPITRDLLLFLKSKLDLGRQKHRAVWDGWHGHVCGALKEIKRHAPIHKTIHTS